MPIRTNRGRAAVYRRLWGWPLRSPRHLMGTLVFLAILVTALGIVLPKAVGKPQAKASPTTGTTTSVTATAPGVAAPVPTSNLPTRLSVLLVFLLLVVLFGVVVCVVLVCVVVCV